MLSNASRVSSGGLDEIDAVALGQAGLQALALAGTAILARYVTTESHADGMTELEGVVPHPQWTILMRAISAFSEPAPGDGAAALGESGESDPGDRQAAALTAMCRRARTTLTREHQMAPRRN
ncbi:hypothetical protein [Actinopolymorpha rutila]|uniref:Uncharacterized protein n=1 Tax=Actinopolymorpha rutila TaxID=446787 RepID=A0A852ZNN6_9ACTN|nr:hypothetical protein [Actinopolymorpha rutila]NYH93518.1 hypothetical protein [Actinopolymorpha rutila]